MHCVMLATRCNAVSRAPPNSVTMSRRAALRPPHVGAGRGHAVPAVLREGVRPREDRHGQVPDER